MGNRTHHIPSQFDPLKEVCCLKLLLEFDWVWFWKGVNLSRQPDGWDSGFWKHSIMRVRLMSRQWFSEGVSRNADTSFLQWEVTVVHIFELLHFLKKLFLCLCFYSYWFTDLIDVSSITGVRVVSYISTSVSQSEISVVTKYGGR